MSGRRVILFRFRDACSCWSRRLAPHAVLLLVSRALQCHDPSDLLLFRVMSSVLVVIVVGDLDDIRIVFLIFILALVVPF